MYERLVFRDVVDLLNHSRVVTIEEPLRDEAGWALYRGYFRTNLKDIFFHFIFLKSGASAKDIEEADDQAFEGEMYVVYPPSLGPRVRMREIFEKKASRLWTTREFLFSFVREELTRYRERIIADRPPMFVEPRLELADNKTGDDERLLNFLLEETNGGGDVAIVLAEPGQGKTYLSRHLVAEIAQQSEVLVPILVNSDQWKFFPPDDLRSLSKTIMRSFAFFGTPISWVDGYENEFLTTALRLDMARIVFDGLDEYVLRNAGSVSARQVLDALRDLAETTGARIIVTTRSSFWANMVEGDPGIDGTFSPPVYRILPFDHEGAESYFRRRNLAPSAAEDALALFVLLHQENETYAGRGFVLWLIADLFSERNDRATIERVTRDVGRWLINQLCRREETRAELPLSEHEQVALLSEFAGEVRTGVPRTTETISFIVEYIRPDLRGARLAAVVNKLKEHPLLRYTAPNDEWRFHQRQIEVILLADVVEKRRLKAHRFIAEMKLDATLREDLASAIVDALMIDTRESARARLADLVSAMAVTPSGTAEFPDASHFAGSLLIQFLDRVMPGGSRQDRTSIFLSPFADHVVRGIVLAGTIARLNLRGVKFEHVGFEGASWASCTFDEATEFVRCSFVGGSVTQPCESLGYVQFTDCSIDNEAKAWVRAARLADEREPYTMEDLARDFHLVIDKFVHQGGLNTKEVKEKYLARGPIRASRHQREVIEVLLRYVLQPRPGANQPLLTVRDNAREAVRFYATNNSLTGPLRQAFEDLSGRLNLRRPKP